MSKPSRGKFDHENFSKNAIPRGFAKEDVALVEIAVMLGWELNIKDGNSMSLMSKQTFPPQRISLNTRGQSRHHQGLMRTVIKYADPRRVDLATDVLQGKISPDLFSQLTSVEPVHQDKDCPRVTRRDDHVPHTWHADEDPEGVYPLDCRGYKGPKVVPPPKPSTPPSTSGRALERHEKETRPKQVTVPTPKQVEERVASKRTIVSERPWLAKRRAGEGGRPGALYPSKVVIERSWSDGSTDYACAQAGCDFDHVNPRSVAAHTTRARGHSLQHETPAEELLIKDASYVGTRGVYTPRQDRVEALAGFLATLGELTPENAAQAALEWVHAQSDTGGRMSGEAEYLDDAQVLVRIRRLLDRGEYLELRRGQEELTVRVQELTAQVEDEKQGRIKAEETLQAFRDLVNES